MFKFAKIVYGIKPQLRSKLQHSDQGFKSKRRQELLYNIGLYGAAFGCAFGAVPFYKLFCEHIGIDGNLEKKDYSMKGKKMDLFRKYTIKFMADTDPDANWVFEPVQRSVTVHAGETALMFYRAFNRNDKPVVGFATYQVFPEDASIYFSKIQCFCFNQQLLNPKEELQLPIYFYMEPEINEDPNLRQTEIIHINYRFYKSKNQELAKWAEEETRTVKKHKLILQKLRDLKKQAGELSGKQIDEIKKTNYSLEEIDDFDEWAFDNPLEAAERDQQHMGDPQQQQQQQQVQTNS